MGTPEFALPAFRAINESRHEVITVYTQPPRPKGRGHKTKTSPVHEYAERHWIPVQTPHNFKKDKDAVDAFRKLKCDVAVVAAYGLILPVAVLDAPRFGCLNIHASLLPKWRGASPIQNALWKGDEETGISIMQMEEGLDTGAVISEVSIPIETTSTASSLYDELSVIGADMIVGVLDQIAHKQEKPYAYPQKEAFATYAPLLTKEDGKIIWTLNALEIDRQVRALNPWPGVTTTLSDGRKIKILETEVIDHNGEENAVPGTILDKAGRVACGGNSVLKVLKVQPENGKTMDFQAALNGQYLAVNDILGQ